MTRSNDRGFLTDVVAPKPRPASTGVRGVSPAEAIEVGRRRADLLRSMGIEDPAVLQLVQDLELVLDPLPELPDNTADAPDARERELDRRRQVVMAKIGEVAAKRHLKDLNFSTLFETARNLGVDPCFPNSVSMDEGERTMELSKWMEGFIAAIHNAETKERFAQRAQAPWWELVPVWAWALLGLVLIALVVGNILLALRR